MTSDTPRTNANKWATGEERLADKTDVVDADFARQLERELAAAIKQRDEARRMFCHEIAESGKDYVTRTEHTVDDEANARNVAAAFGWDCFKEGGGA